VFVRLQTAAQLESFVVSTPRLQQVAHSVGLAQTVHSHSMPLPFV